MPLTTEQLELRKGKVMASDVAAYLCLSPYQGPLSAWAQNQGLDVPVMNDAMQAGTFLEDGLIRWAMTRIGYSVFGTPGTIFHPVHKWAGCTPDAEFYPKAPESVAFETQDGIQIKVHALHMAAKFNGSPEDSDPPHNDLIPAHHLVQCQLEMFVTGALVWWLGAYFGGADFRLYRLYRDEELIKMLRDRTYEFWRKHMDPAGPMETPPATGYEADEAVLKRLHPLPRLPLLQPTDRHYELADRYQSLSARVKELEAARDEAKNLLCQSIGDADGIEGVCTWKLVIRKPKPDYKFIANLHPDFTALATTNQVISDPYRIFRLTNEHKE